VEALLGHPLYLPLLTVADGGRTDRLLPDRLAALHAVPCGITSPSLACTHRSCQSWATQRSVNYSHVA
jgi:hypothetical protein